MADAQGTPPVIEFDALLAPIAEDNPTGPDLREDTSDTALFYTLRSLRQQARAAERRAEREVVGGEDGAPPVTPPLVPEWAQLLDACDKALRESSKDLEVVAWMVEALTRLHGFAGVRDGFNLAADLAERYWDAVHSMQDPDDPGAKAQPFAALNGTDGEGALIAPLKKIEITEPGENGALALWNCELLQRDSRLGEVDNVVRNGGRRFYLPLNRDLLAAREAVRRLGAVFEEKMAGDAPSFAQLVETLDAVEAMLKQIATHYIVEETAAAADGAAAVAAGGAPGAAADVGFARTGTFASREQAIEMLSAVARYFREREPHSPISYAIEGTVDRARMPLYELLADLLPDDDTRRRIPQNSAPPPPPPE